MPFLTEPAAILEKISQDANQICQFSINHGLELRSAYHPEEIAVDEYLANFYDNIKSICTLSKVVNSWADQAKTLGRTLFAKEETEALQGFMETIADMITDQEENFGIIANENVGITISDCRKGKELCRSIYTNTKFLKGE